MVREAQGSLHVDVEITINHLKLRVMGKIDSTILLILSHYYLNRSSWWCTKSINRLGIPLVDIWVHRSISPIPCHLTEAAQASFTKTTIQNGCQPRSVLKLTDLFGASTSYGARCRCLSTGNVCGGTNCGQSGLMRRATLRGRVPKHVPLMVNAPR